MQLFSADITVLKENKQKNFLPPKTLKKKLPSKIANNPTRLISFSPANFCFVKLRLFYCLLFSHLWSCHKFEGCQNSLEFLWHNSILHYSTQLPILRPVPHKSKKSHSDHTYQYPNAKVALLFEEKAKLVKINHEQRKLICKLQWELQIVNKK